MDIEIFETKEFLKALRRVEAGEKADLVFAELWANAAREDYR